MKASAFGWAGILIGGTLLALGPGCAPAPPDANVSQPRADALAPEADAEPSTVADTANSARAERRDKLNSQRIRKRRLAPQEDMEQLQAIGYVQTSDVSAAGAQAGVVQKDGARTAPGINLFVSAHAPVAYLMGLDGTIRHSWRCPLDEAWPDFEVPSDIRADSGSHWRRVYAYPNGDLLAIFENIGMIKLDKASNLLWAYQGKCHHAMDVAPNGNIFVLANNVVTGQSGGKDVWTRNPTICELDGNGKELRIIDVLECFRNSIYRPILDTMRDTGDIFHTNTIHVLDGAHAARSPAFQAGNLLICSRQLSCVAIIDPAKAAVVWALSGMWQGPHEPTFLDNGHMLIFDNRRFEGRSQVLEFDPFTQEIVWRYAGTDDDPLWSAACSLAQRLPNGNTLITETQGARVIEVNAAGEIVWQYVNTNTVPGSDKLANIHMMLRLPPDFDTSWIGG